MLNNESALISLYKSLKPFLFSNQVIFYNLLFNFTRYCENEFYLELDSNIETLLKNKNHKNFVYSLTTKKYYKILTNTTENIERTFPSIKSNIATNITARSDVSQSMKKKGESSIPRYWRLHYLQNKKMDVYKSILDTILKYYILIYHYDNIDLTASIDKSTINFKEDYLLKLTEKATSNGLIFEQITSIEQLENIIINQIYAQCGHMQQISLQSQWDFYVSHIECYGDKNIDKFYALERYANENVYCSYELADIYYYGSRFISSTCLEAIEIKQDYQKAAYYYKQCSMEPNLIIPACWSLGYLYMNNKINSNPNNINKAIELFNKCGLYPPALNSLGQIYKQRADAIFNNKSYNTLTFKEKEFCNKNLILFVEKCYSASCNDWIYAYNALYAFYVDDKYSDFRHNLIKQGCIPDLNPISLLQQSAMRKNPWATDTLAVHYITDYLWDNNLYSCNPSSKYELFLLVKSGKQTLSFNINQQLQLPPAMLEAKTMLKQLNDINFARGTFHLAINFYSGHPLMGTLLKKAAELGNEQAIEAYQELLNALD